MRKKSKLRTDRQPRFRCHGARTKKGKRRTRTSQPGHHKRNEATKQKLQEYPPYCRVHKIAKRSWLVKGPHYDTPPNRSAMQYWPDQLLTNHGFTSRFELCPAQLLSHQWCLPKTTKKYVAIRASPRLTLEPPTVFAKNNKKIRRARLPRSSSLKTWRQTGYRGILRYARQRQTRSLSTSGVGTRPLSQIRARKTRGKHVTRSTKKNAPHAKYTGGIRNIATIYARES